MSAGRSGIIGSRLDLHDQSTTYNAPSTVVHRAAGADVLCSSPRAIVIATCVSNLIHRDQVRTYIFHQNTTFPSTPIPMPYTRHRSAWTYLQQPLRPRFVTTRHMLRYNFNVLVWDLLYLKRDPHPLRKRTISIPVQEQICRVGVELRGPGGGTGCGARDNGAAGELPRGGCG